MRKSIIRDLKAGRFELTDDGRLFLPAAKLFIGGVFDLQHVRNGEIIHRESFKNIVVNEGLNHILNVTFNAATQVTTWYLGLFEGNYTPVAGDTAATFPGSATECTAYDEATRVAYVEATSSAQSTTNTASRAAFTISATKTVYGAFLTSASAKSATTGTLMAAAKFSAARAVIDNDVLNVGYTINASAS